MNGRLNFYFLLSHTYVLCAQTVLISASCRIFLGLKSFWHFPTLFIRSIEQIFGLCKGHIIVDYCLDLGGKSDTCWLHTISIGKQCKELLDYNDNIGFIFHDDAKKLDRPAKNRYSA